MNYIGDQVGTAQMELASGGWPLCKGEFTPLGQELDTLLTYFSNAATNGSSNRYRCTGRERDAESGLDMMGARYYGSSMGRFMSPDPSGLVFASLANPQSLNLYSYAQNNPLIYTDPTGLDCAYLNSSSSAIEDGGLDQHSSSGECGKTGGYWVDGSMTNANVNANAGTVQLTGTNDGTDATHASYKDTSVYVDSWLNTSLNQAEHITMGLVGQQQVGQNPRSDGDFLSYSLNPALGLDCATWAQQVLHNAGIQTGPMQPYPNDLMKQLGNQFTVLSGHQ